MANAMPAPTTLARTSRASPSSNCTRPARSLNSLITYSGDRSVENLISFISEKGTHGIGVVAEPIQVQEQVKAAEAATPVPDSTEKEAAKETAKETAKEEKKEEKKEDKHDEL